MWPYKDTKMLTFREVLNSPSYEGIAQHPTVILKGLMLNFAKQQKIIE